MINFFADIDALDSPNVPDGTYNEVVRIAVDTHYMSLGDFSAVACSWPLE